MNHLLTSLGRPHSKLNLIAGWGAIAAMTLGALPSPTFANEDAVEVTDQAPLSATPEDSVLVATRQALDESYKAPDGALEPISQVSEYEPSPAKPPAKTAAEPKASDDQPTGIIEVTDKAEPVQPEPAQPEPAQSEPAQVAAQQPAPVPGDLATAFTQEEPQVAAAPFRGIVAGQSTRDELVERWGKPSSIQDIPGGKVLTYQQERFDAIEVKVEDGRVELIKAQLNQQSTPERLAAKLRVDRIDSVTIKDEKTGVDIAVVYPEKGLTMLLSGVQQEVTPQAPQFVTHLVLQTPDAEVFALRAQSRPEHAYTKRLADLDQAIALDAQNAYAQWLRSGLYLATGQPVKAEADAAAALKLQGTNPNYRLRWCEALAGVARYDEAVLETRKVVDAPETSPLVKAQALALLGNLASLGDAEIAEKAIGFHTTAISLADKLAASNDDAQRRAAKRLLIDSHLAVAVEVSRRSYDDKAEVVAQWIGRASGLTEDFITNEEGSVAMRVVVARRALEALANFKPSNDPGPWVTEAGDAAGEVVTKTDDLLLKNAVHWELGQALTHAMRVAHSRREADRAIGYGKKAIDHLAKGAESGDLRPDAELLVGRLYFHIGAAYAVHKQDHQAALEWYEQAVPLLTTNLPESELVVPRQRGEALVSMGVSYWEQEQHEKAMKLTVDGAEIMQAGVKAKVLDRTAMAVPYGNLATMHSRRGEDDLAKKYATLVRQMKAGQTKQPTEVATQPPVRRSASSQPNTRTQRTARTAQRTANTSGQRQQVRRQSPNPGNTNGMQRTR